MIFTKKYNLPTSFFASFAFIILGVTSANLFAQEASPEATPQADKSESKVEHKNETKESKEEVKPIPEVKPNAQQSITKLEHSISTNNHKQDEQKKLAISSNSNTNSKNTKDTKDIKTDSKDSKSKENKTDKLNKSEKTSDDKKSNATNKPSTNQSTNISSIASQVSTSSNKLSSINQKENSNTNTIDSNNKSLSNNIISNPAIPKAEEIHDDVMSQYGKIIAKKELNDGITAWVIEKNLRRVILYTSQNKSIVLHGNAWDAKNKQNINQLLSSYLVTNKFVPNTISPIVNPNVLANNKEDWKNKKFKIPDVITGLNNIYGIKEGSGSILDTVYVFFDPRCPYCRQAYIKSRNYISSGKSIKWIPAIILGDDAQAQKNAGHMLQSSQQEQADMLKKVLEDKENFDTKISDKTLRALLVNKQSLNILANKSGMDGVAVPIAFFFDKRSGKVKYLKGIHIPEVMEEIFKGI
ncbi:MAG: hypothetical protein RLZZ210_1695 [Pseudomonadota bacterium]|jgi:hypothetical protein